MYDDDSVHGRRYTAASYDPTLAEPEFPIYHYAGHRYHLDMRHSLFTPTKVENLYVSLIHNYCGIVLAYDLSSLDSWNEAVRLQRLIDSCFATMERGPNQPRLPVQVMLLGLKADIHGEGWPPLKERELFAHEHGALFAECSARTGGGVHEAMGAFVARAHKTIMLEPESYVRGMKLEMRIAFDLVVRTIQRAYPEPCPCPEVYRKRRWLELVERREIPRMELDHRGGTIGVALWGPSGIGKTALVNKVSAYTP